MNQRLIAAGVAGLLAVAAGCSRGASAPTSPTTTTMTDGGAAADGSTLKVTAPTLMSPANGIRLEGVTPTLVVGKSTGKFSSADDLQYRFEITRTDGTPVHTSLAVTGGGDQISYRGPDLQLDTRYRWRARAEYRGERSGNGPWSDTREFLTIDYRGLVPRPPNGVWPSNGNAVVGYVAQSFPSYLRPTATLNERLHNMEFLRDRIIETAICGGMDVTWNLKRGVGPHSHDAVAWRDGNKVRVMDIASAFDDKNLFLVLTWNEVAGPPGYDPYRNHPGC
jgi:hypothetical protein